LPYAFLKHFRALETSLDPFLVPFQPMGARIVPITGTTKIAHADDATISG